MKKCVSNFCARCGGACGWLVVALACASMGGYLCGCSKESGEEKKSSPAEVENPQAKKYGRMLDAAYTNQLAKLMVEQKRERGKMLKLKAELDELAKLDPSSPRLAELERELKAAAQREQLHQLKAQMVVRERIRKEQSDIRAAQQHNVKKGN